MWVKSNNSVGVCEMVQGFTKFLIRKRVDARVYRYLRTVLRAAVDRWLREKLGDIIIIQTLFRILQLEPYQLAVVTMKPEADNSPVIHVEVRDSRE